MRQNSGKTCGKESSPGCARLLGTGPAVTLQTEDGKVWDFHKNLLEGGNRQIWELTAFDVTEQYRLGEELQKRNETLRQVNLRLQAYNRVWNRLLQTGSF